MLNFRWRFRTAFSYITCFLPKLSWLWYTSKMGQIWPVDLCISWYTTENPWREGLCHLRIIINCFVNLTKCFHFRLQDKSNYKSIKGVRKFLWKSMANCHIFIGIISFSPRRVLSGWPSNNYCLTAKQFIQKAKFYRSIHSLSGNTL